MTKDLRKIFIATGVLLLAVLLFLFFDIGRNWEFALRLRGVKVAAILVVSACVAFSTISFQTLTQNRILTPSIMGFESVFLLLQTILVFLYGGKDYHLISKLDNFLISIVAMIGFAMLIYLLIYKRGKDNLYLLLLVGVILGTLMNALSSFMQLVIDPNDFFIVQGKMFASFNRIHHELLLPSVVILLIVLGIGLRATRYLDVMALGREQAINLGIPYNRAVRFFLILIAILVSVSTALVGPLTFLGLLVSNLTYELFRTYRHSFIIPAAAILSSIILLGGQWIMEWLFHFSTPISTIINLVGGLYFMYLLLRKR